MSGPPAFGLQYEREIYDELSSKGFVLSESCAGSTHKADLTIITDNHPVHIECKTKLRGTDFKQCVYKIRNGFAEPSSKNESIQQFFRKYAPKIEIKRDSNGHLQDIYRPCPISTLHELLPDVDYIFIKDSGRYRIRENDPLNLGYPILQITDASIRIREKNHGTTGKGTSQKDITAAVRINAIANMKPVKIRITPVPAQRSKIIVHKPMKSCLRYPGGKTRAIKTILPIIREYYGEINKLCSPFCGGCSIEFALNPSAVIVNDKFEPLYNFWMQVQNNKDSLIETIKQYKKEGITKDRFASLRERVMNTDVDPIERAAMYFIINRCSFSGATLSGGFSTESAIKRFTDNSINSIVKIDLSNYTITNDDFTVCIDETPNDYFIFADPPYYLEKGSRLYGKNGDLHESFDHRGFFEHITKFKGNWLITYNDCPFIRDLYKDYDILPAEWAYGMNKSKESSEIIILSKRRTDTIDKSVKEIQ